MNVYVKDHSGSSTASSEFDSSCSGLWLAVRLAAGACEIIFYSILLPVLVQSTFKYLGVRCCTTLFANWSN